MQPSYSWPQKLEPVAEMVRRSVVAAVERDLAEIAKRDEALAESGVAMAALSLASDIDSGKTTATAKASCVRALAVAFEKLRAMLPDDPGGDQVDDLAARREARRQGVG